MTSQASFLGGTDILADLGSYPAAYTNLSDQVDANEIYRAVIAPPPLDYANDPTGNTLLPEDQTVAASRMYNAAGIVITIEQDTAGGSTSVHVGVANTPGNPNNYKMYDSAFSVPHSMDGTGGLVVPNGTQNPTTDPIIQGVRTQVIDPREYANGVSAVNMTTLDVAALTAQLPAAIAAGVNTYNGVVYIYDKSNNNGVNPNTGLPTNLPANQTTAVAPNTLNAIRIVDGQTTPNYPDVNGNPLGFTVVTNNGVYVQGDYKCPGRRHADLQSNGGHGRRRHGPFAGMEYK